MRQARNFENEIRAIEIRIRAERRCGELLAEMEKAKRGPDERGQGSQRATAETRALSDLGISKTQASRWQKLAAVPEAEFEATFARTEKPSTTEIISRGSEKKRNVVDDRALWLWGRLLDFERNGLLGADPEEICATIFCDSGYRKPAAGRYRRHPNRERPDCRDPSCAQSIGSDGRGGAGLSDRPRGVTSRNRIVAIGMLYDRAWGKPREYDPAAEEPEDKGTFNPRDFSPQELTEIERVLR